MLKSLLLLLLITVTAFPIASCGQAGKEKLSPAAFNQKLKSDPQATILDVRTPEEFSEGHLQNAVNLNYNADDFKQSVLKLDKHKPVYVYCLSGGRSSSAATFLRKSGFSNVYELNGGILAWKNQGLPLAADAGAQSKADKFTKADFDQMISNHHVVLIDYYAPWCAPCKQMEPSLARLTNAYSGKALVYRLNIDEAKALSDELKIANIPLFHLYKDGKLIKTLTGYQEEATLRSMIESAL